MTDTPVTTATPDTPRTRQPPHEPDRIDQAIERARRALMARQHADGHWCFEFETDCTIS